MTLALFLLGIVIITVIARYNESNKLFWALLTAFTISFCAGKLFIDNSKEKSEVKLTQAYPMQGLTVMSEAIVLPLADIMTAATTKETSKPAGQANTPALCEFSITRSVCGVTHEQYFHILPNPPNGSIMYDTS